MSTDATCKYKLTDSNGDSNEATVTVTVIEVPPPAASPTYEVPFGENSAWNRPIGTGATWDSPTAATTLALRAHAGKMALNHDNLYGAAAVLGRRSDPTRTVSWSGFVGPAFSPITLRIPANAPFWTPAANDATTPVGDRTFIVFDEDTGVIYEFFHYRKSNNTADLVKIMQAGSLGHSADFSSPRIGTSASGMSVFGGHIRVSDLTTEGKPIRQAFRMATAGQPGYEPHILGLNIRAPAGYGDNAAPLDGYNNGLFAYGDLISIPPVSEGGPNLDSLGLSEPGRRLAQAFRDYGLYVIDHGAFGGIGGADGPIPRENNFYSNILADVRKLVYNHCRRVSNSYTGGNAAIVKGSGSRSGNSIGTLTGSNGKSWPAGGGDPIAPNPAYDA